MARARTALFEDRQEAGRRLADRLAGAGYVDPVVLGLPRGGVPVAAAVAERLGAPLDVVLVRKLGAPGQEELAIGAIVDGAAPQIVRNEEIIAETGAGEDYIRAEAARQLETIERRRRQWLADHPFPELAGRTVVIVDDGCATGATARAAVLAIRRAGPARIVLAVPVASRDAVREIGRIADEVVALAVPEPFGAIGYFYADFGQVSDAEVGAMLRRARGAS
jgi:predicted phosphoribosyltransferase